MKTKKINLESGQAMLLAVVFFVLVSSTVIFGIVTPVLKQVKISNENYKSKQSYFLSQSGLEDVIYRLKNGQSVSGTEILNLNNAIATTTILDTSSGKQVVSNSTLNNNVRKMQVDMVFGTGVSFNYGVQTGQGGFVLQNSSSVTGNIYSSGTISGSGNTVYGDAVSASSIGLINNIHTTGSAYAHTIQNSTIDKNAYYVTKTNTSVGGISYPNSPDQPTIPLPISDDQIDDLEGDALAGGVISSPCPYIINSSVTIGPKKITCDLEISGSPTVTLNGSIWVTGNISIKNSAIIKIASSLGNKSVAIIADKSSNRSTSSSIDLVNSAQFQGSGSANSFIFLISQNNSAETGGSEDAISMDNSSSGKVVLYAPHGLISINNSAALKSVTGYKIKTKNSANIIYDTGLANTLFTGGPGGGYDILDWFETQ